MQSYKFLAVEEKYSRLPEHRETYYYPTGADDLGEEYETNLGDIFRHHYSGRLVTLFVQYSRKPSTMDAANLICNTTDTFARRMWFVVIIFSSIGCAALCSKGFMDYLSYAVLTKVHFDVRVSDSGILSDIDIPSLVFCSHKTIKNSLFYYNAEAKQMSLWLGKNDVPNNINFSQWYQKFRRLGVKIVIQLVGFGKLKSQNPEYRAAALVIFSALSVRGNILLFEHFCLFEHCSNIFAPENVRTFLHRKEIIVERFIKYCPKPEQNEDQLISIDIQAAMGGTNVYHAVLDIAAKTYTSRRDFLLKCFWQGVSFRCNTPDDPIMFSDAFTDDGLCFSFTYDSAYVQNLSEKLQFANSRGLWKVKTADLTILLDLKQYKRCGHAKPTLGEGFYIAAGDRRRLLVTNMLQSTFRVLPGYEYKVTLTPVVTIRRTEHLKRCTSKKYLSADGKSPPLEYAKETCQALSLLRMLIEICHCTPPVPNNLNTYVNEQNLGLEIKSYKPCINSIELFSCLTTTLMDAVLTTLGSEDTNCVYACMELKFTTIMHSMNRLTETRIKNFNITSPSGPKSDNETIDRWASKNLIILHFDFERQKYQEIEEIQRFTSSDLLLYIASACGLFFGMSVYHLQN
uniref:Uncharacterized protein n=1 Tax=Romanomermis culicivorax TaxID=13658 RepID=A0A915K924_ROMCU